MKVTCFLTTYNSEEFVDKAIESVLNQTFTDFEFIIIDDNSTDRTPEKIRNIDDNRIDFFELPRNYGLVNCRNKGLQLANGEYFAVIDSDDYWHREKLYEQVNFLEENDEYSLVGTRAKFVDEKERILEDSIRLGEIVENHSEIVKALPLYNPIIHSSTVFRTRQAYRVGGYSHLPFGEDYNLYLKLCSNDCKLYNIQKELTFLRFHNSQTEWEIPLTTRVQEKIKALKLIDFNPSYYIKFFANLVGLMIPDYLIGSKAYRFWKRMN